MAKNMNRIKIRQKMLFFITILFIIFMNDKKALCEETVITLNLASSHIIDLPAPASTILIGNPAAVNAILDNPRRLILMPLQPTATNITVLGRDGQMMLQAIIMVSPRREQAVMIDRHCTSGACPPSTMHYCTDHECLDVSARNAPNTPMPAPGSGIVPANDALTAAPTSLNVNNTPFSPPAGLPLPNQEPLP